MMNLTLSTHNMHNADILLTFRVTITVHAVLDRKMVVLSNVRDGTLMIWGGGSGKSGKKSQLLIAWEKNSTQQPVKLNSWLAGKKNSSRILCPRPPQIINGPSLSIRNSYVCDNSTLQKGSRMIGLEEGSLTCMRHKHN